MRRGMNNVWALVLASFFIYGAYAVLMGVAPGIAMSWLKPTPGVRALTPLEAQGRQIYVAEGCAYCHTQQIRPLKQDLVFGRPSVGGDYVYDTPQLLGTERTGPDLTNIGIRQPSETWQYIHLWDPRAVVNASIMPRYTWLFQVKASADRNDVTVPVPPGFGPKQGVVVATQKAQALVAYLKSLKQQPLGGGSK
jgi:cytochrome c oxidase cbb3-type subunit 2